jgi:hypothetical protein
VLTSDIASWAHEVRLLGNESVHELGTIDAADAREVYDITTVIAEILYSHPARVARMRARRESTSRMRRVVIGLIS